MLAKTILTKKQHRYSFLLSFCNFPDVLSFIKISTFSELIFKGLPQRLFFNAPDRALGIHLVVFNTCIMEQFACRLSNNLNSCKHKVKHVFERLRISQQVVFPIKQWGGSSGREITAVWSFLFKIQACFVFRFSLFC